MFFFFHFRYSVQYGIQCCLACLFSSWELSRQTVSKNFHVKIHCHRWTVDDTISICPIIRMSFRATIEANRDRIRLTATWKITWSVDYFSLRHWWSISSYPQRGKDARSVALSVLIALHKSTSTAAENFIDKNRYLYSLHWTSVVAPSSRHSRRVKTFVKINEIASRECEHAKKSVENKINNFSWE